MQTPFPLGLNNNIYQSGNISKSPSIDIFSIYSSLVALVNLDLTGLVKKGNIKRKARVPISINDLHIILLQSSRHTMLSRLSALPLSSLRNIDDQADVIILRTDPFYLVQSYTQHILRPHIDSLSDHVNHYHFSWTIFMYKLGMPYIDNLLVSKWIQNVRP